MKTWRSIVKAAHGVVTSRLFVGLMALSLVLGLVPTQSIAEALEGVTGEPATEEVVLTDPEMVDEQAAEPAEQSAAEPTDEVVPPADEEAPVEEATAPAQEAPEEEPAAADEAVPAAEPTSVSTLTAKSGKATVTASFDEGTFEEPVTLHVEEIAPGDARFSQVEGSLDELAEVRDDFAYSHARAFDIWFEDEAGTRVEPSKDVSVSIDLGEPVSENAISTDVVHIPDNGEAELVTDADVAADGSAAAFESDAFSIYVVTADEAKHDGSVAVGDQYFTTLAAALEVAQDGDTINIIGETADTAAVAVNKSVTILSDGADGSLPNGIDPNAGTITLGGGSNTLTMGSAWARSEDTVVINIEDGVHITGGMPLYLQNENATLNIHGGKIEQTSQRDNWNYAIGVWAGEINEITGGEIIALGEAGIYNATIGTISGGKITSAGHGIYNCDITTISGGEINAGSDGIYLSWNTIETISGGTISAKENAINMYYEDTIDEISGGTFIGENGAAIYTGGWSEGSTLNTISGGIFVGKNAAIAGEATVNEWVDISGGAFKSTAGTQAIDSNIQVDFTNGVENVRWIETLDENSYKVPDGYIPSTDTVTVDGVDGNFHYFDKQITVTYDGNGGKTESNQTTVEKSATTKFTTAENTFFHPDEKAFKEWNTAADGSGTSYAEGAQAESSENITLYAIWDDSEGPVSIGDVQYKNIRAAMVAAQDGDVIKVNANCVDTNDPILVDKNVTIVAGNSGVKSTRANLKVVDGKKLTLGDGNADSVLTMTGTVDVTEGSLEFNDGIELKNTITVYGESSTAAIKGGKIAAKSFAIEVRDGATVTEISGGELSSTNAAALFIRKGVVESISGENTSFTADNDSAVVIWQEGKIETIDNGRFISKKRSGYAAGLYVEGTVDTINDGYFEGYLGLQISGEERDAISPTTTQILGGEFYGKGGGRGNAINLGQIDSSNKRTYVVKNVKAVADTDFAIIVGWGNVVEEISNVEASGAWGGLRLYNVTADKTIEVGTIADSTFTYTGSDSYDFALEMGKNVHVGTIKNTVFDGGVAGGAQLGSWVGAKSSVDSIKDCQFLGSNRGTGIDNYASIGSITGTKVTGRTALDNGYNDGKYGDVGTLGEGNEFTGVDYGIDSTGPIETITGGTYIGGAAGVHNGRLTKQEWVYNPETGFNESQDVDKGPATIGTITGGTFSGAIGIDNEGSITSISGPVDVTGTEGPAVKSAENGVITTISGAGVYKGSDYAIQINNATDKTNLEPDITAVRGDGRYKTSSNTVDSEFNSNTNIVLPEGYHVSKQTTSVDRQEGEFRYLVKDNTIIYDGNGRTTAEDETTVTKTYEVDKPKVADNGEDGVSFEVNGWHFTGWNTAADGLGTSYAAGDEIELNGSDITLYAQWKDVHTVSFNTDGGNPKPEDQHVVHGEKAEKPTDPTKTGYTFQGWVDENGNPYDFNEPVTEPKTLKAQWTLNNYPVTFDSAGGSNVPSQNVDHGFRVTRPSNPTRNGYTFAGWVDANGNPYDFSRPVTGPLALRATWTRNPRSSRGWITKWRGVRVV